MSYVDGKHKLLGVVTEKGENIYTFSKNLNHFKWISEDDFEKMLENRDPMEAPSCPYTIQREKQGKLVWLSGPPGVGKSTTGKLLAQKDNFIFYEGDCLMNHLNPFIPLDVEEPSNNFFSQKPVKVLFEYLNLFHYQEKLVMQKSKYCTNAVN